MVMTVTIEEQIKDLVNNLLELDPVKIIAFGSYATGEMHDDSDLDLLIVLNKDKIPQTYEEKMELKVEIRKKIREINKKIAIDIIVYTLPEYNEIIKNMGSFLKEIHETGKLLYEKAS
jgi:uncharacterized protein